MTECDVTTSPLLILAMKQSNRELVLSWYYCHVFWILSLSCGHNCHVNSGGLV